MKVSYSVVLFNQTGSEVRSLISNIINTVPGIVSSFKIYLINNSSDNYTLNKTLKELSEHDSRIIIIISPTNCGFGSGHNLAIERIKSDVHFIVNPDIVIPNSFQIEEMIRTIISPGIVLVAPKILSTTGELQPLVKRNPTVLDSLIRFLGPRFFKKRQEHFVFLDVGYDHPIVSSNLPGSFLLFDTRTLKKIHGFDERYFLYMEDSDISRTMSLQGTTLFIPTAFVEHEWQRGNTKTIKGIIEMTKSLYKYFSKWGWKLW